MKNVIVLIILILGVKVYGQDNQIESTGNVGIGTLDPQESLHIKGLIQQESDDVSTKKKSNIRIGDYSIRINNNTNEKYYRSMFWSMRGGYTPNDPVVDNAWICSQEMIISDVNGWRELITPTLQMIGPSAQNKYIYSFNAGGYNSSIKYLSLTNRSGNYRVGILTTNPSEALDVNGNINTNSNFLLASGKHIGYTAGAGSVYQIAFKKKGVQSYSGGSELPWNDALTIESDGLITFHETDGNVIRGWMDVNNNRFVWSGNVGIGVANPTEKLAVDGTILAKEVRVSTDASDWPDFVFENNYHLKNLSEVEAFIKANKHLPEIPSADEMEEAGVNLAEMNKLLLMKVEELTLYLIEAKRERHRTIQTQHMLEERIKQLEQK